MSATDAKPFPLKNAAYRVYFPIFDNTGALVTAAAALDTEISKDGGTFADATNEATEIATSSGIYYLDLTAGEMNADSVAIIVKTTTTDAKTTPIFLYPVENGDIPVNVTYVDGVAQNIAQETNHRTTIATLASQTSFTLTAGSADDDAYNGWAALVVDQSTATQKAVAVILDYTGSTKRVTLDADPGIFTMEASDIIILIPGFLTNVVDSNVVQVGGSSQDLPTATAMATIGANVDLILVDTGTDIPASLVTIAEYIDTEIAAIKAVTDALPDSGALSTITTHLTDIKGATFSGATDSLEAIRDRGDAAWTTGAGGTPPQLMQSTTITGLSSQTVFNLTAGSADDDAYNGAVIVFTDQSTATQKSYAKVSDYVGSSKTITLAGAPAFTIADGDTVNVIAPLGAAGSAPSAASIRAEIDANSTQLAAIVNDTNELQADLANGGRLDLLIDSILADTTTNIPATLATIASYIDTEIGTLQTSVDAVPTAAENREEMDSSSTLLAAIKAVTDNLPNSGALNNLSAADINAQVLDVLNTDSFTELSAVPGAATTLTSMIRWVYAVTSNKITVADDGSMILRNRADNATIGTTTAGDDGTTGTRGSFA